MQVGSGLTQASELTFNDNPLHRRDWLPTCLISWLILCGAPRKVTCLVFLVWPESVVSFLSPPPCSLPIPHIILLDCNPALPGEQQHAYLSGITFKGSEVTARKLRAKARTSFWSKPNSILYTLVLTYYWLILTVPQTTVLGKRLPLKTNSLIHWVICNKLPFVEKRSLNGF